MEVGEFPLASIIAAARRYAHAVCMSMSPQPTMDIHLGAIRIAPSSRTLSPLK
jgi:hypothetical protein